ncbi:MAG TPA: prepilin-type N-terminal cleavage/methylation domain-containing protein [Syntrophales bacterium]|nr:prepilin-type N-terminal cleavage/methylation domain-containing protein [Syntrophales bacterium]HPQ43427.1 prepilin-type N-terminal cleavage/methylation domain-containing protein [Syntrophales bacterium]
MYRTRPSANIRTCGFTLVEILVAISVMGIAVGAIYGIFIASNRSYQTQDHVAEAQQGVRIGTDFMVRDIRMAGLDPLETEVPGIEEATATKIRITYDTDMNGIIDNPQNEERITYEYDAANDRLRRCLYEGTASESWQTLISDVSALSLVYLDTNGNTIASPVVTADLASIKTIVISMTCDGTDSLGQTFSRTLNSRVICRNQ